tara:strand:+ start:130 stop:378 length:249 start_codon:yes stop_codon:yes gene_type:complete
MGNETAKVQHPFRTQRHGEHAKGSSKGSSKDTSKGSSKGTSKGINKQGINKQGRKKAAEKKGSSITRTFIFYLPRQHYQTSS